MSRKIINLSEYSIKDVPKLSKLNVDEIYLYSRDKDALNYGSLVKAILKETHCKVWVCTNLNTYRIDVIMACVLYMKTKHGGGFVVSGEDTRNTSYIGVRVKYVKDFSEVLI